MWALVPILWLLRRAGSSVPSLFPPNSPWRCAYLHVVSLPRTLLVASGAPGCVFIRCYPFQYGWSHVTVLRVSGGAADCNATFGPMHTNII